MRIIVASDFPNKEVSQNLFNTCNPFEIVTFSLPQILSCLDSVNSMYGVVTGGRTSRVCVKDINISEDYYRELLSEYYINHCDLNVSKKGIMTGNEDFPFEYPIGDLAEMLLAKAEDMGFGIDYTIKGREIL